MKKAFVFYLFYVCMFVVPPTIYGKMYTKCGLAKALTDLNFPRSFIGNWICLIESESFKNTTQVTQKADHSKSLGLFQINDKNGVWCKYRQQGGECNVKCEDLLNEDIRDDASCAKKVWNKIGFKGWDGWSRNCYRNKIIPIPKC